MSTSKYLCKRDGEGYHFCRTIGCSPREGKGEATQAPQQLSQNKSMKETGVNPGGRPPSTEAGSIPAGDWATCQKGQGLRIGLCVKGLLSRSEGETNKEKGSHCLGKTIYYSQMAIRRQDSNAVCLSLGK